MKLDRMLPMPLFAALFLGMVALNVTMLTRGFSPSLLNPDEGAHYVNALFLGDWIRAGFPSPMAFARDFYAHFPRLSIGHWPPGWYMLEAPFFAVLRPSPMHAMLISSFVAGLPAFAVFWAMARLGRQWLGLGLGIACVLLPLSVDAGRYILLDQPVALVVALGAVAWFRAAEDPRWWRFLVFAALAAFAPLVKGNGALIGLVPAIDIALNRRWELLRRPSLWIAAALAMLVVAPWYWLSFKISAGGFNYAPGLDYALLALQTNLTAIWDNVGPFGIALAALGGAAAFRAVDPLEARVARLAIAVVLATLLFQSAVPVALEPRYVTPMLPWIVVLAGLGLIALARMIPPAYRVALPLVAIAALVPAFIAIRAMPPKPDSTANQYARTAARHGGAWMVDGRAGDEGAVIASAAWEDEGKRDVWILRASQWLSTSDFMGRGYRLKFADPGAIATLLDTLGVQGVVAAAQEDRFAYPHSRLLQIALAGESYVQIARRFERGPGTMMRAIRRGKIEPNVERIRDEAGAANATRLGAE